MLSSTLSWIFRGYIDSEKKKGPKAETRPVFMRLASYRKRIKNMYKKYKLKHLPNFSGVYLLEDFTNIRAKMLRYMKEVGKNKFVFVHPVNGKICMKQLARQSKSNSNDSDTGTGNRRTIDSPDDLFKYEMDIDFD